MLNAELKSMNCILTYDSVVFRWEKATAGKGRADCSLLSELLHSPVQSHVCTVIDISRARFLWFSGVTCCVTYVVI